MRTAILVCCLLLAACGSRVGDATYPSAGAGGDPAAPPGAPVSAPAPATSDGRTAAATTIDPAVEATFRGDPAAAAVDEGGHDGAASGTTSGGVQGRTDGSGPVSVHIPRIGVDAPLVELGLNPDRSLEVPTDFSTAGWYTLGPRPGQRGPAVIAGHVSSRRGPAVFYRLRELAPGDVVMVAYDGGTVEFVVTAIEQHPKDNFPTERVYAPTTARALRLITCGGEFNSSTGHFRDNVIVFAEVPDSA